MLGGDLMKTYKEYPEPMIMIGSLRRIGRHKMLKIPVLSENQVKAAPSHRPSQKNKNHPNLNFSIEWLHLNFPIVLIETICIVIQLCELTSYAQNNSTICYVRTARN